MRLYKALNLFLEVSNRNVSNQLPKLSFLNASARAHIRVTPLRLCSNEAVSTTNFEDNSVLKPVEKIDLSDYGSAVAPYFNFQTYADKSPLIQKYIDLGVNLYEVQKRPEGAQYLVTLSLEKIEPYLHFLKDIGVPAEKIGKVITKNPFIFKEDLDDLQVRVNYLWSKKFDTEMITTIVLKNSKWLSTPVKVIDERLGYLQETFKLKGDQVRKMVVEAPSIALVRKKTIITNVFVLKEEMGLDVHCIKRAVVAEPRLLTLNSFDLMSTYEYLTDEMKVPMDLVLKQPKVLTYRKFILKERHKFLESLGKAQYSNMLPGYVSLMNLVETTDAEFCENIAKTQLKIQALLKNFNDIQCKMIF